MSACHDHFTSFLNNHVNLNPSRLSRLRGHVSAVNDFLIDHEDLANIVTGDVIPQGSYARRTIIKPYVGNDYDADVLLPMDQIADWQPCAYVERLHQIFEDSGRYKGKSTMKKRCLRLDYADRFHIDIVPFITDSDGNTFITHRIDNEFILEDPTQLTTWFDERNRRSDRNLVKVIRLMKYLRDRCSADIPSAVLNVILAECVDDHAPDKYYSTLPKSLVRLVEAMHDYLTPHSSPPWVDDRTGQNLAQRWTPTDFINYKSQLTTWATRIRDAYDAPYSKSIAKWQKVFGERFPTTVETVEASTAPGEMDLERDFGITLALSAQHSVKMTGRVRPKKLTGRPRPLSRYGNMVAIGKSLVFKVDSCSVEPPVSYYWKVRNSGPEARRRHAERGEIRDRGTEIEETTSFDGDHWVQVWVVKDDIALATDRQDVTIIPRHT